MAMGTTRLFLVMTLVISLMSSFLTKSNADRIILAGTRLPRPTLVKGDSVSVATWSRAAVGPSSWFIRSRAQEDTMVVAMREWRAYKRADRQPTLTQIAKDRLLWVILGAALWELARD